MKKFRVKHPIVEAQQYKEGVEFEGLDVYPPVVVHTRDRTKFYVTGTDCRHWLSCEKSEETDKYIAYQFENSDFKAHRDNDVIDTKDHEKALLYCKMFGVPYPKSTAYVNTVNGQVKMNTGDYAVKNHKGEFTVFTEPQFFDLYEDMMKGE